MSVPSPWSVKGVQPKTREAAKDLARREGLTLGEWLNRLIGDVDDEGDGDAMRENPQPYPAQNPSQAFGQEPVYAQQGQSNYPQPLAPFPNSQGNPASNWNMRDSDNSRLTTALEQLTRRLDFAANPAPAFAPVAFPAPVAASPPPPLSSGLADRIEASERRSQTALNRVDASLSDVRQTQAALAERLRAMEATEPQHKSLAALRGLETALGRLSQQVFDSEARSEAFETRIDEKLAQTAAKFSVDTTLSDRLGEIEHVTNQALETLDTSVSLISQRLVSTESMATDTNGRLADAMIDLSARLTGVEQNLDAPKSDTRIGVLDERVKAIEDVTTQAIESVDKGLGLVSQRVAATEALAHSTNERLVEALIDLSARLVQLENFDSQDTARDLLNTLEDKTQEFSRHLMALDTKIDATRNELTQEVKTAVAGGVDGRMAEIAKALADRLDVSERRSGEALEKIGAEMARASISLDQRLREIEERGSDDVGASMRHELAKMARVIDERMASMEQRNAHALDQAGGHIQQLAQTLSEKLDASETRSHGAVQSVSSQMEQLAERLQARQDETAKNLVARMESGEARGHQELHNGLAQLSAEVRSAEDRTKYATAPLQRDFAALVDRLDQVEASSLAPYTETIARSDQAITIGQADDYRETVAYDRSADRTRDAFGTPSSASGYQTPAMDDFAFAEPHESFAPQEPATQDDAPRRPGFGAPFPGTETSSVSYPLETLSEDTSINFDEDPFSMADTSTGRGEFDTVDMIPDFDGDLDEAWSEVGRAPRNGGDDYLTNARNAATRAAAERLELQKSTKKSFLGGAKKQPTQIKDKTGLNKATNQKDKTKPAISTLGIVAAAALVVTTGVIGVNYLNRDKTPNELPAALKPASETPTVVGSQTNAVSNNVSGKTGTEPQNAVPPVVAAHAAKTPAIAPAVQPTPSTQTPRFDNKPSVDMKRLVTAENAKAREAVARSQAAKARLKPVAPLIKASPVRPQIATPRTPVVSTSGATAVPKVVPKTAPNTSTSLKTPPPRVAVAGSPPSGTAQQLYDRAIARQQAGDAAGAVVLMKAAADTGDARSINRLAKMYERGEGVVRDLAQARALTERAASRGSRQAIHNMGVYYAEGEGPQRDLNKAAENFRRAANKGVTDSQFNLGAMAEQGLGGQKSDREAYYWFSIAGRNGDRDAAAKSRELAARLPAADKAAEDRRAAAFRPEPGGVD